jgi:acetyl-CoA synthetase (ADP-forming)
MQMNPKKLFKKIKAQRRNNLTEWESIQILQFYKIPLAKAELAKNINETLKIAKKIGYPVVLKVCSPDVIHKTDVGGLALNLKTEEDVRTAFNRVSSNVKKKVPRARIHGMLVQKMVENGQEVIVGGKKNVQFGQTIMFGLGGILVEVFEDVSFRVIPIDRKEAEQMIQEIKGYKILKGYRGRTYDIKALVEILMKASRLLEENQEIKELDINPIIVLPKGAVAVDARIVIE